LDNQKIN